jgi:hypothetical protein
MQGIRLIEFVEDTNYLENDKQTEIQEMETIDSRDDRKYNSKGECMNCIRLRSKGLSTDFCLEHYATPRNQW